MVLCCKLLIIIDLCEIKVFQRYKKKSCIEHLLLCGGFYTHRMGIRCGGCKTRRNSAGCVFAWFYVVSC
jgi:hypothetical protein